MKHFLRLLPAILACAAYLRYSDGRVDGLTLLVFIVVFASIMWEIDALATAQYEAALDAELEAYFALFELPLNASDAQWLTEAEMKDLLHRTLRGLDDVGRNMEVLTSDEIMHNHQDPDCKEWAGDLSGFDLGATCRVCKAKAKA